jgi:hypothetical protein
MDAYLAFVKKASWPRLSSVAAVAVNVTGRPRAIPLILTAECSIS